MFNNINFLIAKALDNKNELEYKNINESDVYKLLHTSYSEAFNIFKQEYYIFRGHIKQVSDIFISEPKFRTSSHTLNSLNIYNDLMSNILPSWQNWPKRNHSFICTTGYKRAENYGSVYMVFPKNGTDIAICPNPDIWDSIKTIGMNLDNFNILLTKIIYYTINYKKEEINFNQNIFNKQSDFLLKNNLFILLNDINHDYLEKVLSSFLDNYNYYHDDDKNDIHYNLARRYNGAYFVEYILSELKSKKSIINILDDLFRPDKNEFTKLKIKDFNYNSFINKNFPNNEIWFDNEALFIHSSLKDSLFVI